jgi:hypothetical protein
MADPNTMTGELRVRHAARRAGPTPSVWTRRLAVALGLWAAWYAAYRFYYAFGGQVGMVGRPAPAAHFEQINFVGGVIILLAAVLPTIALWVWRHSIVRRVVPVVGWLATVGFSMHALTMMTVRIFSLTGVHPTHHPADLWLSYNRHQADLHDLLFNEPWFLIEGCLWGLFTLTTLKPSSRRRWRRSAAVMCVVAVAGGVLAGLGTIPTLVAL